MNSPVVVVLSKFPDIFEGFRESVDRDAPELLKLVVWDGMVAPDVFKPWESVAVHESFHMARNGNVAFTVAAGVHDLIYCGDDVRIIEPETIKRLQAVAYSDPDIGIVSPRIKDQDAPHDGEVEIVPFVTFPMVYIKAEVIAKVGYLDEEFEGYGVEDLDYSVRVRQAGFKIAYANQVHIKHGDDVHRFGVTFRRTIGQDQMEKDDTENWRRFAEKYGIENNRQRCWEFIRDLC